MPIAASGPVYFAGGEARRFVHDGRIVEAARFTGNGVEIAAWCGGEAVGSGLTGTLSVDVEGRRIDVPVGDWVVLDGGAVSVEPQELFANRYRQVG